MGVEIIFLIIFFIIPAIIGFLFSLIIKGISYLVSLIIGEGILNSVITVVISLILARLGYTVAERNSHMTSPIASIYFISVLLAYALAFRDDCRMLLAYFFELLKGVFQ